MIKLNRRCEYCKQIFTVGVSGSWRTDPFQEEINADYSKHWLCDDCASDSAMEI